MQSNQPEILKTLSQAIGQYKQKGLSWPYDMPESPIEAAKWWVSMQEKQGYTEKPQMKKKKPDKDGVAEPYWEAPYINRIMYTWDKFTKLKRMDQQIIIGCAQEGVYWRGDDMNIFYHNDHSIYEETIKMKEMGIKAYKNDAIKGIKSALSKVTSAI